MQRAHKIRLNPTPEQEAYFRRACGTTRFVFNWGLGEIRRALDEGRKPEGALDLKKRFNAIKGEQFPWVYEVTKCAVEGAFRNLGAALANFRQSKRGERKGRKVRFPHFKSKRKGFGSFYLANDKFSVDGHWIAIPKLGQVNMTEALRFEGRILGATVSYQAGWWWVSIQVDIPFDIPVHVGHPVGVDVGIKDSAVDSDGQRHENQAPLRQHLRRIKRLQRTVSRRVKGSANRRQAVLKLAKAHYQVACRRQDSTHKLTTALARKGSIIGIESLNVAGMLKNRRLALSLSDAALSRIHRQLRYKTVWYGGKVVAIDPFFPSSQIHADCGYRYRELRLDQRLWVCPYCGELVDRDLNAAKNIRDEALRLSAVPVVATSARTWPVDGVSDLSRKAMPDEAGMEEYLCVLGK